MFHILASADGAQPEPVAEFPQGEWSAGVRESLEKPVTPVYAAPEQPADDYLWALSDAGRALLLEHTGASGVHNRFAVTPYDVNTFLEASPFEDGPAAPDGRPSPHVLAAGWGGELHPGAGIPDEPRKKPATTNAVVKVEVPPDPGPKYVPHTSSVAPAQRKKPQGSFTFVERPTQKTRMMIRAEADAAAKARETEAALAWSFKAKEAPKPQDCMVAQPLDPASHSKLRARQQREVRYRRKREQLSLEIARCCKDGFQRLGTLLYLSRQRPNPCFYAGCVPWCARVLNYMAAAGSGEASKAVAAFKRGTKMQKDWRAMAGRCGALTDEAAELMKVVEALEKEAGDKAQWNYYTEFLDIMLDYRHSVTGASRNKWFDKKHKKSPNWAARCAHIFCSFGLGHIGIESPRV